MRRAAPRPSMAEGGGEQSQEGQAVSRRWLWLALAGAAVGMLAWWLLGGLALVIHVPRSRIQEALDTRFPVEKTYLLVVTFRFLHPRLQLDDGTDRLRFSIDVEARFSPLGVSHAGSAQVSGVVRYDRDHGDFYLANAHLEQFSIAGVAPDRLARVQEGADLALGAYLERMPIHHLDQADVRERLAHLLLTQVRVHGDGIDLTLAPGAP